MYIRSPAFILTCLATIIWLSISALGIITVCISIIQSNKKQYVKKA